MVGTEHQIDLDVHAGETGHDAGFHGVLNTLVHSGNVFLGNDAAGDGVDEFVPLARIRFHLDDHMTVLPATAGLLGVLHVHLGGLGNGFAVGDLGLAHIGIHIEFAGKTVHDDFKMQLAHARNKGLIGFLVALDAEGGVFLGELVEGG